MKCIAQLARLKIDCDKLKDFTVELQTIMKMMENLPNMKKSDILSDFIHVERLRNDVVVDSSAKEDILGSASRKKDGYFLVPQTVD